MIKVAFACENFVNFHKGGAEVQMEKTFDALNRTSSVSVEMIDYKSSNITQFDIVHFFKSSPSFWDLSRYLNQMNIPYVVSSIIFPQNVQLSKHYFKIITSLPFSVRKRFIEGRVSDLWDNSEMIYPNTEDEANFISSIKKSYGNKIQVIPNALDIQEFENVNDKLFCEKYPELSNLRFVLNVGRIDHRKNQYNLAKACKELDLPLVLIGKIVEQDYFEKIKELNYEKIYYLGPIYDKEILYSAYSSAKVFCLPSTLETPGIVAMEAGICGTPIVVTSNGGAKNYFGDHAKYVKWNDLKGIKQSIMDQWNNPVFCKDLMKNYSWDNVAKMYVESYSAILN